MKKHFILTLALLLTFIGLTIQSADAQTSSSGRVIYLKYELKNVIVTSYDHSSGLVEIDRKQLKDGYNHIATDPRNSSKLFLIAKKGRQLPSIVGMAVQDRRGKWTKLGDSSSSSSSRYEFGCPNTWNRRVICYGAANYHYKICFTLCTPTTLTLQLPSNGL